MNYRDKVHIITSTVYQLGALMYDPLDRAARRVVCDVMIQQFCLTAKNGREAKAVVNLVIDGERGPYEAIKGLPKDGFNVDESKSEDGKDAVIAAGFDAYHAGAERSGCPFVTDSASALWFKGWDNARRDAEKARRVAREHSTEVEVDPLMLDGTVYNDTPGCVTVYKPNGDIRRRRKATEREAIEEGRHRELLAVIKRQDEARAEASETPEVAADVEIENGIVTFYDAEGGVVHTRKATDAEMIAESHNFRLLTAINALARG